MDAQPSFYMTKTDTIAIMSAILYAGLGDTYTPSKSADMAYELYSEAEAIVTYPPEKG